MKNKYIFCANVERGEWGINIYTMCQRRIYGDPNAIQEHSYNKNRNKNEEHSCKYLLHINESINQYNDPSF